MNPTEVETRRVALVFVITVGLCVPFVQAQPRGYEGYQVIRVTVASRADLQRLLKLEDGTREFQIWSEGIGIGMIDVRVSPSKKRAIDGTGLRYEVLVANLQRHLDVLYVEPEGGGFFDALRTYDEVVGFMQNLASSYPSLATMMSLGSSVEGRPLWALRITGGDGSKPGVMYHGAQHGSEPIGMFAVAYLAQHLLTNYQDDPTVTALVDGVEWFLLPIMNPDGYERYDRYNTHWVDLNRNWDGPTGGTGWSGGPWVFSEPETAALRDFFLSHPNVRVHVDFHGYVHLIMWPWGYTADYSPDHWTFDQLGTEMQKRVFAVGGTSYAIGPSYTAIYPVTGGSIDYSYGELGLWGFVIELDYPSWGAPSRTLGPCQDILPGVLYLAEWISDCNGNGVPDVSDIAAGTSADCNVNGVPDECEYQGDCNGDGVLDICDLASDSAPDCNGNAVPDSCDITDGTSDDCTNNRIPDECEQDCNQNEIADSCDLASGTSADCNGNKIPDECEPDCNGNGVQDGCDVACGDSEDCDNDGVPDECQTDCNVNGIPDLCDLRDGTSGDANGNNVPDECEDVWFVDDDAPEGGDGRGWDAAFRDLQDALDAASAGDVIQVAGGTYTPDRGTLERTATFQLISGVEILGGFAGIGAPDPDMRDYLEYETSLSGDLRSDDPGTPGYSDCCTEHNDTGCSDTVCVDAVCLMVPDCCTIEWHETCVEWANRAIVCRDLCRTTAENSYHVVTASGVDATALLDGFTIIAGNANGERFNAEGHDLGAGIYNDAGSPTLRNCTIRGNSARSNGGGMWDRDSRSLVTGCIFTRNTCGGRGGAVCSRESGITFRQCVFTGNKAYNGAGGVYNLHSSPLVERCRFLGNTTHQGYGGGAILNLSGSNPAVVSSLFADNSADRVGGAVYNDYSSEPTFVNCTFVRNSATRQGGAMVNYDTTPAVEGCIFWLNSDENGSTESSQIYFADSDGLYNPQIQYSCIQGWTGAFGGVGNMGLDPVFVDPLGPDGKPATGDEDWRLRPSSPCINSGDPGAAVDPDGTDLAGEPRMQGCRVDIGAYESSVAQGRGDFGADGDVDLADFAALQLCYGTADAVPSWSRSCLCVFDADDGGTIDLRDFAGFQGAFTGP